MNKLRFILLFAVLLVVGHASAYDFEVDGLYYNILDADAKTVEVTNKDGSSHVQVKGYSDELVIPSSVVNNNVQYTVVKIAASAFYNSNIKSLVIHEGVDTIGQDAFNSCYALESVNLSSTIKVIGDRAFQSCWNASFNAFPSALISIGNGTFHSCYKLTNLVIPEGCESIGPQAFCFCSGIQKVELPSTLLNIGEEAFNRKNSVKELTVLSHIKEPFEIINNVFFDIENAPITTLFVPIGTINKYQAANGWNVFSEVYEGEPFDTTIGDFSYNYVKGSYIAKLTKLNNAELKTVLVPAEITIEGEDYNVISIGHDAFKNSSINSVKIEDGVRKIEKNAFHNCIFLSSAFLPNSITSIEDYAFASCFNLDSVEMPGNVVTIGNSAFYECKIQNVNIPAATKFIGESAFGNCGSLSSIRVDFDNCYYDSRNDCNAIIETESNRLLRGTSSTIIPNSVLEIGNYAFSNLYGIIDISLPNSITKIGVRAFQNCSKIKSIFIPSSVESIGSGVFAGCQELASIIVDSQNSVYDSRNNCNAIIEKQNSKLISGCNTTIIPRGVKIIGSSAFEGCYERDSLIITYGVETIEDRAMISNLKLKYVELPNSIQSVSSNIFSGCRNLTQIVSKIKDPNVVNVSDYAFRWGYSYNGITYMFVEFSTLYVPKGKKELYKQVSPWNSFTNIEEMDGEQLSTPTLYFDGRYVTASTTDKDVDMYYSTDGNAPSIYYDGPIAVHNLGTITVMAEKSFCLDSDEASINIEYLYDGDTLKTAKAGLMADAIKWCKNDSIVKMTVVGPINTTEFETIRTLKNLQFLNLADAKIDGLAIPDNAFANSSIVSFVAPTEIGSVGTGIFSGCQQLAAVSWTTNKSLPNDALSDVSNPNLLLYLNASATAPSNIKNVVKGGKAGTITLSDATGNNNFYCPVAFHADSVVYTRNFQQTTEIGICRGWETIALPFDVDTIYHEKGLTLTPFANYADGDSYSPFWLYTLEKNNITPASSIKANTPYLICMPNNDLYSDEFVLGGNVTFRAANVDMPVSKPIEMLKGKKTFVPTYQRVAASDDIYVLNVNQEYEGYPAGSLFVRNFREARPFEAYTLHPSSASSVAASRIILVGSLIDGNDDTTGIIDVMLKKQNDKTNEDRIVRVYSLSGTLIKQCKANEITNGLPKGIYIANGKKFIVR